MAIEYIEEANPPALPSHLPDEVLILAKTIKHEPLNAQLAIDIKNFRKAADYISAGQNKFPFGGLLLINQQP